LECLRDLSDDDEMEAFKANERIEQLPSPGINADGFRVSRNFFLLFS